MPASRFAAWVGAPTKSRVTRVTGVTNPTKPSSSLDLQPDAAVTRAAEPRVTEVTAPSPTAIEVTQVTQSRIPAGSGKPIDNQFGNPANPGNPRNDECASSPNAPADPSWWRDFFEERAAHLEIDAGYPRIEAEALAFDGCIAEWHLRHGALPEPGRCAGCDSQLDAQSGLVLDRGVRVHFGGVYEVGCVVAYDRQSRDNAIAALQALGVNPPEGFRLL